MSESSTKDEPKPRRCPVCGAAADETEAAFPFCSKRCRQVDLAKWLNEAHRISRPVEERDLEEGPD